MPKSSPANDNFRWERLDAVASGIGAILLFCLAVWGTVRVFQGADSVQPNPLRRGGGGSAPGVYLVILMGVFAVGLFFRSVFKWRLSRSKKAYRNEF
jgi:hypothetical protein